MCTFQDDVDPALETEKDGTENMLPRRELTVEDEHEIWKDITLTQ